MRQGNDARAARRAAAARWGSVARMVARRWRSARSAARAPRAAPCQIGKGGVCGVCVGVRSVRCACACVRARMCAWRGEGQLLFIPSSCPSLCARCLRVLCAMMICHVLSNYSIFVVIYSFFFFFFFSTYWYVFHADFDYCPFIFRAIFFDFHYFSLADADVFAFPRLSITLISLSSFVDVIFRLLSIIIFAYAIFSFFFVILSSSLLLLRLLFRFHTISIRWYYDYFATMLLIDMLIFSHPFRLFLFMLLLWRIYNILLIWSMLCLLLLMSAQRRDSFLLPSCFPPRGAEIIPDCKRCSPCARCWGVSKRCYRAMTYYYYAISLHLRSSYYIIISYYYDIFIISWLCYAFAFSFLFTPSLSLSFLSFFTIIFNFSSLAFASLYPPSLHKCRFAEGGIECQ